MRDDIRNIVILTGPGISAESGLATFRGPDGLWEGHRVEDVATPEALRRGPAPAHAFYDARRAGRRVAGRRGGADGGPARLSARPGSRPGLVRRAAGAAERGRAQCGPPGAGPARLR